MSYYKEFFNKVIIKGGTMEGIICVDGVVGVGKSTLSELISKRYNIKLYEEPVTDNPILDKYYHDRKRWSFPLQVFFLNKRFKIIKDASKLPACVLDRSIYGDVIFSRMLVHDGLMTEEEFKLYEELLYNMLEHIEKPKLMIYLETSVDNAIKKIKKRGRDYEQIVPREYWENLDKNYREYFESYNLSDLLKINVDEIDFVENEKDREYIFNLIDEKLGLCKK
ncbi:deoxynucleoside kinase [Sneathia sanguinegens]|uniref:deoxynucleoside kinase n=1 Tax=Sneathia sanguinegens TaxID=40543 RepID=UPI002590BA3E|nr:deoxynucleoside kinase [Sneathia sanguinegens]MDU4652257.1 deoxynucleoside kinase [Sneathia sanguinegens]MDU7496689.1 deoxynucleoside kinase [Sneathia sanguinegens]